MNSYYRMSNISFSFSSTSLFYDGKLKVELRTHYKIQMILKVIGPLSGLYLAENEDRKGCNTHIRRMFCISPFVFVIDCPYLAGEFHYCYFSFSLLISPC